MVLAIVILPLSFALIPTTLCGTQQNIRQLERVIRLQHPYLMQYLEILNPLHLQSWQSNQMELRLALI